MSNHAVPNRSLAADTSWLVLAKTVAFGVAFVLPLVMVRHLSQEDFGSYRQLFLLIGTVITVLPFGFAMSAFYFLPRAANRAGAVAMNILFVHATIAGIAGSILLIEPNVLAAIFNHPELEAYGRLVAAVLFLAMISSFVDVLALANGDAKSAATFIIVSTVAKTILLAAAVISFGSVRAILEASMIHGALQLVFLFGYMRRGLGSFPGSLDTVLLRKQLAYAMPLGLAGWLYWLQMESHHYFVARTFGPASYAIYAIGCASLPLTAVFGESMNSVIIHRVSHLHSQSLHQDVVIVLGQAVGNLAAFYLPLYVLLMVCGRDLIAVIYTPRFVASWPIFAINLTLIPLSILAAFSDSVIRSYTECRPYLLRVRMLLVPLLLVGLWFLTPRYGPVAAISLMVGVNVLEWFIVSGRIARMLKLTWRDAAPLKWVFGFSASLLLAGVAAAMARNAVSSTAYGLGLVVSLAVLVTVYLLMALLQHLAGTRRTSVNWSLAVFPEPMQRVVADVLARVWRARQPDAPPAKAA